MLRRLAFRASGGESALPFRRRVIRAGRPGVWGGTQPETTMTQALAFVTILVIFSIIDTLWLGYMGDRVYRPLIGEVLADKFRLVPAMAFYTLYAVGLTIFAVLPGLKTGDWKTALMWGALFGLFAYGTYDLTNYATLKSWGLKITLMDMTWGVVVSGVSSAAACAVALRLMRVLNLSL